MDKNKRQLRIAIFHFGFFYSGGGEKLVLEEIKGLRRLGHDVTCFAPYIDRERCFPGVSEMAEVQALLPPPPKFLPFRHAISVLLCCLFVPFMALRFRKFDVFFGANQPAPWLTFVLSKILKKPYVIYLAQPFRLLHPRRIDLENGLRINDGDQHLVQILTRIGRPIINLADRISVKQADVILTNGSYVRRWIEGIYNCQSIECPAGCYPLPIEKLKFDNRFNGDVIVNGVVIPKPYVLLTNRHAPQKRFEYAIWGLKIINKINPELYLVITGQETQYTHELRYLVESLRLEHRVFFVGLVEEKELSILYQEAALYVYPSPEEDFGMGIIEAMAAGTPVVAWNNGGPTVTVRDGVTGFLVEPYDTETFAERLLRLASCPQVVESMGRAGHRRARELFSYERHIELLEQVLLTAVESEGLESVQEAADITTSVLQSETDEMTFRAK
jgi:glycosyltransferase involved in cell wall biosynthesis